MFTDDISETIWLVKIASPRLSKLYVSSSTLNESREGILTRG